MALDELERQGKNATTTDDRARVSGFELPDIIRDVVDLLLPELRPYEASLYLYLLRHSVVKSGEQYMRVSVRGLQSGVVKSAYAGSAKGGGYDTSYKTVQNTLEALEAVGAIRKESDPNRDGTLYRVMLPEEIELCQKAQALRRDAHTIAVNVAKEADFYNVRENRMKIYERDGYKCGYCSKQLTRFTATLDHVTPVAAGGDNSFGNLKTSPAYAP